MVPAPKPKGLGKPIKGKMMNLREQYIESLNCALDSCYRDLDYYESIGHQKCIDQVEERIASLKQQIAEAA